MAVTNNFLGRLQGDSANNAVDYGQLAKYGRTKQNPVLTYDANGKINGQTQSVSGADGRTYVSNQDTRGNETSQTPYAPGDNSVLAQMYDRKERVSPISASGSNPYLTAVGKAGASFLDGRAADAAGRGTAQGAIDAAGRAGQGIGTAGGVALARAQGDVNAQRGILGQGQQALRQSQGVLGTQLSDMNGLRDAANGRVPSAAEIQQRSALDASARQQVAAAATARGGNIAAAQRNAGLAANAANLSGMQQLGALRANEQATARGQLSQAGQGAATTALGIGQQNGNLGFQAAGVEAAQAGLGGIDIGRAKAVSDAATTTAGLQGQNYGTTAGIASTGLGALNNAGATQLSTNTASAQDQNNREKDYADWVTQQQALAQGIPLGFAGPNASITIANQQAQQQQQAAAIAAVGSSLAGLSQLGR